MLALFACVTVTIAHVTVTIAHVTVTMPVHATAIIVIED
jgi:hypothetical protein